MLFHASGGAYLNNSATEKHGALSEELLAAGKLVRISKTHPRKT
jgi:hypothetical protein